MSIADKVQRIVSQLQTTIASPSKWLTEMVGGPQTAAKVRIDPHTALTISSFWQGVNVISRDVAQLPLLTYERTSAGKERAKEHPAFALLRRRPNRFMTAFQFKQTLQAHILTWGNAYAYIQRNSLGQPIALWPLLPNLTKPVIDSRGQLVYETEIGPPDRREKRIYRASNVIHLRGLGFDGLQGYSVVTMARESLGLAKATERHGATYFGNYATPQGILSIPGNRPSNETVEQVRRDWKKMTSGENENDVALLYGGWKFEPMGMSNKDSQFLEARQFSRTDIAGWLNLPPHKVGDLSRATFTNIEEQNRDYLATSLMGWLVTWQEECEEKLLSTAEKETDSHFMEFNVMALLRGDTAARNAAYTAGINGGWLNRNEVREFENLNRVEGLDEFLVPLNMGGSNDSDEPEEPDDSDPEEDPEEDPESEVTNVIRAALKPLVNLESTTVSRESKTAENYVRMIDQFYQRFEKTLWNTIEDLGATESTLTDYCKESRDLWLQLADQAHGKNELLPLVEATCKTWIDRAEELAGRIIEDRRHAKNQTAAAA